MHHNGIDRALWHSATREQATKQLQVQGPEPHCLSRCCKIVSSEAEASVVAELGGGGFGAEGLEAAGGRGAAGALAAAGFASPTLKS